jgi:hypothetical protein
MTASAATDGWLCGWRVRSAIPLPEMPAWNGDDRAPDIRIELGTVPEVSGGTAFSPLIQLDPQGAVRLAVPRVASYWIEAGSRVIVEPHLPAEAPAIRLFLLGTVLAILCYRRGLVPLHASAVEVGGGALLMCGPSGLGKSTLAAMLVARGHRLIADDVCVLDLGSDDKPLIRPVLPRLKLWQDAARAMAVSTEGLEQVREQALKFNLPVDESRFRLEPIRAAHIVLLRSARSSASISATALAPLAAIERGQLFYRRRLAEALGARALLFRARIALVRSVPITELSRPGDLGALPALADRVLALVGR